MEDVRAWGKDAAERLFWTFVEGSIGILVVQQLGWIELGDGELWKAAAAGGVSSSLSFIKSFASTRLSRGGTAQLGLSTYSYTAQGPGSAGSEA
jgi:hypothetical protein